MARVRTPTISLWVLHCVYSGRLWELFILKVQYPCEVYFIRSLSALSGDHWLYNPLWRILCSERLCGVSPLPGVVHYTSNDWWSPSYTKVIWYPWGTDYWEGSIDNNRLSIEHLLVDPLIVPGNSWSARRSPGVEVGPVLCGIDTLLLATSCLARN